MVSETVARPAATPRPARVLGVRIDRLTAEQVLDRVDQFVQDRRPRQIAYVNAHCLNQAAADRRYRSILREADLLYADGMGVVWASRLFGEPLPERVTLGDFLPALCARCSDRGYRVFVVAGRPGVAEAAVARLRRQFPALSVVGVSDGYFDADQERALLQAIRAARPDVLLVGMGVPRQEKWIWQHKTQLGVPVVWGVGALFDYYAGVMPRAPGWMRRAGLEWAFRFACEPRRLWRRYLIGNLQFLLRVAALPLIDAVLVAVAWLGVYDARARLGGPLGIPINEIDPYLWVLPAVVAIWLVASAAAGTYRRITPMPLGAELRQVGRATLLASVLTMAVAFLLKEFDLGRSIILPFAGAMLALLTVSRLTVRGLERRRARIGLGLRRTLVVGTGPLAHRLKTEIEHWPAGYHVVGFVSEEAPAGDVPSASVAGTVRELGALIAQRRIQDVFVASQSLKLHDKLNLLVREGWGAVNFHVLSEELEAFARRVPLGRAVQLPLLPLPRARARRWYERSRRILDVLFALAGLLMSLPLAGLIAAAIRLESPGPVVFTQRRVGRGGRVFPMYKFRTMVAGTSPYAGSPNDLHDPRVTRVGRVLRRWSLDELPQLLNVLLGDMSVVGPRPEMPFLVQQYQPWQRRRLAVRPGLTGFWQVLGRKELPLERNLEYDLYYVRHRGWRLDAYILLRTIPAVLFRRGAF